MLIDPYDGIAEIVNGRLVPNPKSTFFLTDDQKKMGLDASQNEFARMGMPLEDAKGHILDAIENISLQQ